MVICCVRVFAVALRNQCEAVIHGAWRGNTRRQIPSRSHFGIHERDGWLVTGEVFEKFLGAAEKELLPPVSEKVSRCTLSCIILTVRRHYQQPYYRVIKIERSFFGVTDRESEGFSFLGSVAAFFVTDSKLF